LDFSYENQLPDIVNFRKDGHELEANRPEYKVCQDYENLFLSEKFSDVTFEVSGKQIKAHKNILSSMFFFCDYFPKLFIKTF
jgi:hypothetical protein